MKGYLLDTTEIIDVLRGHGPTSELIGQLIAQGAEVGVCSIVATETMAGVKPEHRQRVAGFLSTLRFYAVNMEAAMRAGWYLHDFARQGIMLSLTDATIGAVAVTYDLVLITKNRKHYPMREVRLWDWGVG